MCLYRHTHNIYICKYIHKNIDFHCQFAHIQYPSLIRINNKNQMLNKQFIYLSVNVSGRRSGKYYCARKKVSRLIQKSENKSVTVDLFTSFGWEWVVNLAQWIFKVQLLS